MSALDLIVYLLFHACFIFHRTTGQYGKKTQKKLIVSAGYKHYLTMFFLIQKKGTILDLPLDPIGFLLVPPCPEAKERKAKATPNPLPPGEEAADCDQF
jgi:hypothetical protein